MSISTGNYNSNVFPLKKPDLDEKKNNGNESVVDKRMHNVAIPVVKDFSTENGILCNATISYHGKGSENESSKEENRSDDKNLKNNSSRENDSSRENEKPADKSSAADGDLYGSHDVVDEDLYDEDLFNISFDGDDEENLSGLDEKSPEQENPQGAIPLEPKGSKSLRNFVKDGINQNNFIQRVQLEKKEKDSILDLLKPFLTESAKDYEWNSLFSKLITVAEDDRVSFIEDLKKVSINMMGDYEAISGLFSVLEGHAPVIRSSVSNQMSEFLQTQPEKNTELAEREATIINFFAEYGLAP